MAVLCHCIDDASAHAIGRSEHWSDHCLGEGDRKGVELWVYPGPRAWVLCLPSIQASQGKLTSSFASGQRNPKQQTLLFQETIWKL